MVDFSTSYRLNEEDLKKLVYINPVEVGVDVSSQISSFTALKDITFEGKLFS